MKALLSMLKGPQRLLAFGVTGAVGILLSGAVFVSALDGFYSSREKRETQVDALGYARGRAEAAAEQYAEIARLKKEADEAKAREIRARKDAENEIEKIAQDAEAKLASALQRARASAGGGVLDQPVPLGLRLRDAPIPAHFRGSSGEGTDSGTDA